MHSYYAENKEKLKKALSRFMQLVKLELEKAGGKPKSKKDYTEEQQLLADKIAELKKLGELVIIDTKTGKAAASFKSGSKCDEGRLWVSDAGRFFIIRSIPYPGNGII